MAKERLFDLPQTRGRYDLSGKVSGVEKEKFYIEKETKNGSDFRAINFGVSYEDKGTVFVSLNGMPREKVYFSKRDPKTKKTETKAVNWKDREKFAEDGFNLIGVRCGIQQVVNENGSVENIKHTFTEYDATKYLHAYLQDGMDIYVNGALDFNSFVDKNGETVKNVNYRISQIYGAKKPIDFDDESYKPNHSFEQTIVFNDIAKETDEEDKETGRFILSAWIVNYASIESFDFIVEDKGLATLFKKHMKEYNAILVKGRIDNKTIVEETVSESSWGAYDAPSRVVKNVKELVIEKVDSSTFDNETYNKKNMEAAFIAIQKAKNAEENFEAKTNNSDDWGSFNEAGASEDEDSPW